MKGLSGTMALILLLLITFALGLTAYRFIKVYFEPQEDWITLKEWDETDYKTPEDCAEWECDYDAYGDTGYCACVKNKKKHFILEGLGCNETETIVGYEYTEHCRFGDSPQGVAITTQNFTKIQEFRERYYNISSICGSSMEEIYETTMNCQKCRLNEIEVDCGDYL